MTKQKMTPEKMIAALDARIVKFKIRNEIMDGMERKPINIAIDEQIRDYIAGVKKGVALARMETCFGESINEYLLQVSIWQVTTPHKSIHSYDGAYVCNKCQARWGAIDNDKKNPPAKCEKANKIKKGLLGAIKHAKSMGKK